MVYVGTIAFQNKDRSCMVMGSISRDVGAVYSYIYKWSSVWILMPSWSAYVVTYRLHDSYMIWVYTVSCDSQIAWRCQCRTSECASYNLASLRWGQNFPSSHLHENTTGSLLCVPKVFHCSLIPISTIFKTRFIVSVYHFPMALFIVHHVSVSPRLN